MNLREYIEKLNKLYTKHGDLELVYSKDVLRLLKITRLTLTKEDLNLEKEIL